MHRMSVALSSVVVSLSLSGCDRELPKAVNACRWGVIHHLKQDKWPEALSEYDTALKIKPRFPGALVGRALLVSDQQKPEDAMRDMNAAVENSPNFAKAYFYRAYLHQRAGDEAAARKDFARASELDPRLAKLVIGDRAILQDKEHDLCDTRGK